MYFIVGLGIAILSLGAALVHLQQSITNYFDFVAVAAVFGGTLAVSIITLPWQFSAEIKKSFTYLFSPPARVSVGFVRECLRWVQLARLNQAIDFKEVRGFPAEVLSEGRELIELGFGRDKIQGILEERIEQNYMRFSKVANSVRNLAKYPPAFGLAGTVLGLVTLMRQVSTGADAKQTGVLMAIALVATFYGILTSNLVVNPAGESILKSAQEEKRKADISLKAVLLAAEQASLLEAQEVLNSYVSKQDRADIIGQVASEESPAA